MQVSELKKCLHERIDAEDNPDVLAAFLDALNLSSSDEFKVPALWIPDLEQGMDDLNNNRSVDEQAFNENMKKWL